MKRIEHIAKRKTKYDFHIPFEDGVEILVTVGDSIKPGSKLFKRVISRVNTSYFLPRDLGIRIEKGLDYLTRLSGEYVEKGDVLAERLINGGLALKKIVALNDGVISTKRIKDGYLDILAEKEEELITSDIHGVVSSVDISTGLTIETDVWSMDFLSREFHKHSKGFGRYKAGEFVLVGNGESVYVEKDLDSSYVGKIVFAGRFTYPELVVDLYERGAELVITYAMEFDDVRELDLPIIVLGGFGQLGFGKEIVEFINSMKGKLVSVDFEKKNVCWGDSGSYLSTQRDERKYIFEHKFVEGDTARILDVEHYGVICTIKDIENEYVTVVLRDKSRLLLHYDLLTPVVV